MATVIVYGAHGDGRVSAGNGAPADLTVHPSYKVPKIERTTLIDCKRLLRGDEEEVAIAHKVSSPFDVSRLRFKLND